MTNKRFLTDFNFMQQCRSFSKKILTFGSLFYLKSAPFLIFLKLPLLNFWEKYSGFAFKFVLLFHLIDHEPWPTQRTDPDSCRKEVMNKNVLTVNKSFNVRSLKYPSFFFLAFTLDSHTIHIYLALTLKVSFTVVTFFFINLFLQQFHCSDQV